MYCPIVIQFENVCPSKLSFVAQEIIINDALPNLDQTGNYTGIVVLTSLLPLGKYLMVGKL